jgi:hypothetical protein
MQGTDNVWMSMTTDGWTPSANIVNVLVAIHIPNVCAFHPIKNNWLSSHRFKGSDWGADSTGHKFLGSSENFF